MNENAHGTEETRVDAHGSTGSMGSMKNRRYPTPEARRAWSDHLCQRLHEDVSRVTPAGLGRWPGAWDRVEAPSKALLDLLAEWEQTGNEADRRAAKVAATIVFVAWRDAGREWEARPEGEPCRGCGEACEQCSGDARTEVKA
jgi:hypothetical protein